ncbi:MAG: hypothetical protein E6767_14405, partial [Dysgonomonas sp.]|nr:hypothetical protein [Dysgonomonas sp.]
YRTLYTKTLISYSTGGILFNYFSGLLFNYYLHQKRSVGLTLLHFEVLVYLTNETGKPTPYFRIA